MNLFVPRTLALERHQRPFLAVIVRLVSRFSNAAYQRAGISRSAVHLPPIKPFCQHPVVLMPQHIKPALHLATLFVGWLKPVLISDSHSSIVPGRVGDGSIAFHRLALIPTLA